MILITSNRSRRTFAVGEGNRVPEVTTAGTEDIGRESQFLWYVILVYPIHGNIIALCCRTQQQTASRALRPIIPTHSPVPPDETEHPTANEEAYSHIFLHHISNRIYRYEYLKSPRKCIYNAHYTLAWGQCVTQLPWT